MSKFLDETIDLVVKCYDGVYSGEPLPDVECTYDRLELIRNKLDSLGENARRLLEIGIVQDRLVELGLNIRTFGTLAIGERILVVFTNHAAILLDHSFEYTSTTWQDDLINRVKELINE